MKLKDIHSECQICANLKSWNIHMNGEHDYMCRKRPSGFVSKDLHQEPCERFSPLEKEEFLYRSVDFKL